MPGRSRSMRAESSPSSLIVKRRPAVVGAAETEKGCACHHRSGVRARTLKNCPPATCSRRSPGPDTCSDPMPLASRETAVT